MNGNNPNTTTQGGLLGRMSGNPFAGAGMGGGDPRTSMLQGLWGQPQQPLATFQGIGGQPSAVRPNPQPLPMPAPPSAPSPFATPMRNLPSWGVQNPQTMPAVQKGQSMADYLTKNYAQLMANKGWRNK